MIRPPTPLFVESLEIEGGFLDGLSVQFSRGLNVVIGSRGVGKTSLIELIRYCLGAEYLTQRSAATARQHALSVLQDGRVTAVVVAGQRRLELSRTASDDAPEWSDLAGGALVLAQNEIEQVGVDRRGRVQLIDSFGALRELAEPALLARAASLTTQLRTLATEIDSIVEQVRPLEGTPLSLASAEEEQHKLQSEKPPPASQTKRLEELGGQLSNQTRRLDSLQRAATALTEFQSRIDDLASFPVSLEEWPESLVEEDRLQPARSFLASAQDAIRKAQQQIASALRHVAETRAAEERAGRPMAEEARQIRHTLEQLQEGLGSAARRVEQLRKQEARRSSLESVLKQRRQAATALQDQRTEALDEIDRLRQLQSEARASVAAELNKKLGPRINVDIIPLSNTDEYESAVAAVLRGSGLHYNELAPMLAGRMSPREFVEAIEQHDVDAISSLAEITRERAERLISHASQAGLHPVIAAEVDDDVRLSLLDGPEYKSAEELSTGQRCTVVLPILLSRRRQVLIVDQPEDHLDNAYVADTLVRALNERTDEDQFIFTTHNPNIPVLGDAERVLVLASDGRRGFAVAAGGLEDPEIVDAITRIMEGGKEAFDRRAAFYASHLDTRVSKRRPARVS